MILGPSFADAQTPMHIRCYVPVSRLKQGLAAAEPLTWDLLMALALLDGLAGDGGSFWQVGKRTGRRLA